MLRLPKWSKVLGIESRLLAFQTELLNNVSSCIRSFSCVQPIYRLTCCIAHYQPKKHNWSSPHGTKVKKGYWVEVMDGSGFWKRQKYWKNVPSYMSDLFYILYLLSNYQHMMLKRQGKNKMCWRVLIIFTSINHMGRKQLYISALTPGYCCEVGWRWTLCPGRGCCSEWCCRDICQSS